jgi:hypothetical protein
MIMPDREKVFKGLETCSQKTVLYVCGSCPYNNDDNDTYDCTQALSEDAFALIKEQQTKIEQLTDELENVAWEGGKQ